MLDRDALDQLKGLKNKMESAKERTRGIVRGTAARYGFVKIEDGREVFLPPDEMLKVFPGDRVKLCLRQDKDKRPMAEIEGLLESALDEFTGLCVAKGKARFVQPDVPGQPELQRWMFLPPEDRNGAEPGDYVRCAVYRHPIRDGRAQAKVLDKIGHRDEPGIKNRYTMARHGLAPTWSEGSLAALGRVLAERDPASQAEREDFTDLSFVSIDAARTQDIDDALYAEVTSEGWLLYVAIADPAAFIDADSPLRRVLAERASSVYFHGDAAPMLPESIAWERCALAENELRPALVCRAAISEQGEIGAFRFFEARIRSRAKLSYYAVDRYLGGHDDALICHATPLEALFQVSRALRRRREQCELVMEERREYRWLLDDKGHIVSIEPGEKLLSQRLVEECMVVANRCAARQLAAANATGPFVVHDGFRRDRLKDRERFVELYAPDLKGTDLDSREGYRALLKQLAAAEHELPLRSMVNRLLARARLSKKPGEHRGLSVPLYTNCTSPLRKYLDFLVHLQLKATLRGESAQFCQQPELDALSQRLTRVRRVSQEAERWLSLEYLRRLQLETPGPWNAHVAHMGKLGFTVRLDDNGLEGYVDLRGGREPFHFDKWTATLHSKARAFRVDTPVAVTLAGEDASTPHLALFELTKDSGLKAGAEPPAASAAGGAQRSGAAP